jgi:Cu+-exporting ATPase
MALEPTIVVAEEEANPELVDMTRRFWGSLLFAVPVLVLAMAPMIGLPVDRLMSAGLRHWLELLLATPVVIWGAKPFFERAWASVINRSPNMFTLIAMGVTAAYGFSVVAVVAPGVFPDALRQADGSIGVYFESAAVIVVLVLMGQVLNCGLAEQPPTPYALCWNWPRRRLFGSRTAATRKTWRSTRSKWATAFGSDRVRRCR